MFSTGEKSQCYFCAREEVVNLRYTFDKAVVILVDCTETIQNNKSANLKSPIASFLAGVMGRSVCA